MHDQTVHVQKNLRICKWETYKNFMQIDWVTDADKKFLIEFFVHKYVEQTQVICLFWTEVNSVQ